MGRASERLSLGKMQNPVRGFLHGTAAAVSVVGAFFLCAQAPGDRDRQIALLIFALSLAALYAVSSLYHSVPWGALWKQRMQRLDHSMIYVLIAGTYTPIAFIVLDGPLGRAALGAVWGIAGIGVAQKLLLSRGGHAFSITLQTIQGWLALLLLVPLAEQLPWPALLLTLLGGVLYTLGMLFLVARQPRLWPRVFSYHEVFHILVIAASALHYAMTYRYVAGFAGV